MPSGSYRLRLKPKSGRDMQKVHRDGWHACDSSSQYEELRIMRYELTRHEWAAIKPMLPNKPATVVAE